MTITPMTVAIVRNLDLEASIAPLRARSACRFGELLVELAAEKGGVSELSTRDLYGLGAKRARDRAMRIASIPADRFPRRACAPGVDDRHWRGGGRSGRGRAKWCAAPAPMTSPRIRQHGRLTTASPKYG